MTRTLTTIGLLLAWLIAAGTATAASGTLVNVLSDVGVGGPATSAALPGSAATAAISPTTPTNKDRCWGR